MNSAPTFHAIAYSGGMIPGYTTTPHLPHPYVIDLAETKVRPSILLNLDHKPKRQVGKSTLAMVFDGRAVLVEGALSAGTPYAAEVAGSAATGMPWEVSIEGSLRGRVFVPEGESAEVNGRQYVGPFYIFCENVIDGLAFVAVGADAGNAVEIS